MKTNYVEPSIRVVSRIVEKGFAGSTGGVIPDVPFG